jgi:hypothetical protein
MKAQYCDDVLVFSIYRMTWKKAGTIRKRKKDETGEVKLKRKKPVIEAYPCHRKTYIAVKNTIQ